MNKPPLCIVFFYHPESEAARNLAKTMYKYLADDASGRLDLRIPVTYTPDRGDGMPPSDFQLDGGQHSVAVVLVDSRMTRRVAGGTGEAWGNFLFNLLNRFHPTPDPHHVLPVALEGEAFSLDERLNRHSFIRLDIFQDDEERKIEEFRFQIMVRALHLLQNQDIPAELTKAPVELFISHAKADLPDIHHLPPDKCCGPVYGLLSYLATGPVDGWYDAKKIPPGDRFDKKIETSILRLSAIVCVVTDQYASREWCRREVLEAKKTGRPIVVVDALEKGETRNFPYLGNVPTIRWQDSIDNAQSVVSLAIREALRYRHNIAVLESRRQTHDVVFGTAPELLTVRLLPKDTKRVFYPDLPLGREEMEIIESVSSAEFLTPLSEIISHADDLQNKMVGVSLSGSSDIGCYGLDKEHLTTLADDLSLFLLMAGLKIAYGGWIGHEGEQGDEENYTVRLFGLVRSYSPLAKTLEGDLAPIVNYVGWPIYTRYGDEELKLYGREAELCKITPPELPTLDLQPDERGWFPPDTSPRRFAWARGLTVIREQMTNDIDARVVMGGKLEGYRGIYPGVLEEALLMLAAKKPLYLIGAFGGAARLVIDVLSGEQRKELTTRFVQENIPLYDEVIEHYKKSDIDFFTPEQIYDTLKRYSEEGFAEVLNNGLDNTENKELFYTNSPRRMVELILQGMTRLKK